LKKIEAAGIQVIGISYDSVEILSDFSKKQKITYPLLSDADSKTITAYGLLYKEAAGKIKGVPYPGTMLIDQKGVIRAKLFLDGFISRHDTDALLKAANEMKR
jgi:peroxiredoxin